MLVIKKIKLTNFMSVGSNPVYYNFNKNTITTVVGSNGTGKSTILTDSLSYALYDKPYRNVTKIDLINNVNCKDMAVELDFAIDGSNYKVIRGLRPVLLEFYKDGELVNVESKKKDYDKVIQSVVAIPYNAFKQIICVSRSNYTPFFSLIPAHRRLFVDSIVGTDTGVLAKQVYNEDVKLSNKEFNCAVAEVSKCSSALYTAKKVLDDNISNNSAKIAELKAANTVIVSSGKLNKSKLEAANAKYMQLKDCNDSLLKINDLESKKQQLLSKLIVDKCTVCESHLDESTLLKLNANIYNKVQELDFAIAKLQSKVVCTKDEVMKLQEYEKYIAKLKSKNESLLKDYAANNAVLKSLTENVVVVDLQALENNLTVAEHALKVSSDRQELVNSCEFIFNDATGLRSMLASSFVELYYTELQNILSVFIPNILIEIDSDYSEKIIGVDGTSRSFNSYSAGEKLKMDLASILAWRKVSTNLLVDCNVLVVDELLDNGADVSSLESIALFLRKYSYDNKLNTAVISHQQIVTELLNTNILEIKTDCYGFTCM